MKKKKSLISTLYWEKGKFHKFWALFLRNIRRKIILSSSAMLVLLPAKVNWKPAKFTNSFTESSWQVQRCVVFGALVSGVRGIFEGWNVNAMKCKTHRNICTNEICDDCDAFSCQLVLGAAAGICKSILIVPYLWRCFLSSPWRVGVAALPIKKATSQKQDKTQRA